SPNPQRAFREAQVDAQNELQALEPRMPALMILLEGPGAKDATVTLDGEKVPPALLGVPSPANPGAHQIEASVRGRPPVSNKVSLKEGGRESIKISVEASIEAAVIAPAAPNASAPSQDQPPASDQGTGRSGMKYGAYGALGAGAIGLGVGTVFAILRSKKVSDSEAIC